MPPPHLLFADEGGGDAGWIAGITGLIIGLIGAVSAAVVTIRRGRSEDKSKERRDTIAELYELIDRQAEDREGDRKTIHDLRDKLHEETIKRAVCEVQLADALKKAAPNPTTEPSK